ncbi:MAG: hypothetical protein M1838_004322 [Thelocarpon superellum]|nr:MAG: hypothetical protein M1838_004322 [Thelocarpon superellum]
MAENAQGSGGGNAGAGHHTDAIRGLPYYEKLRRDLRETLQKKRLLDKNLASLEDQISKFENSYLEETGAGNIIKGFDNYIKGSSAGGGAGGAGRKKAVVTDADRVFSKSSASFSRDSPAPTPSSSQTTPSHAPTPSSAFAARDSAQPTPTSATSGATTKNNKKNKKGTVASGDDGGDDEGSRKRARVSFGGRGD